MPKIKKKAKTRRKNGAASVYEKKSGGFGAAARLGKDDVTGKPIRIVVSGKTEEEAWNRLMARLDELKLIDASAKVRNTVNENTLAEDFVDTFFKEKLSIGQSRSSRTIENYGYCMEHFKKYFKGQPAGTIRTCDLMNFFQDMVDKGLSDSMLTRTYQLVTRMFTWAKRKKYIPENPTDDEDFEAPVSKVEKKPVTSLTDGEINELYRVIEGNCLLYTVIMFMLGTGVRTQEALALRWCDVDFEKKCVHINHALTVEITYENGKKHRKTVLGEPKTKLSKRTIDLIPDTLEMLAFWKEHAPELSKTGVNDNDFVFGNSKHDHWTYNGFRASVRGYLKGSDNELENFRLHRIRHTVATMLADDGANAIEIMKLLGHSQISTTQRYIDSLLHKLDKVDVERRAKCMAAKGLGKQTGMPVMKLPASA